MNPFHFNLTIDILDIIIVAFLFYRLFLLFRGSRATQMFIGLFLLIILSFVAQWLNLNALNWILSSLKTVWVIAFVILFQPELRKALTQMGQNRGTWGDLPQTRVRRKRASRSRRRFDP